jgi:hypothetical protein
MECERYISEGNLEKILLGFATAEEEAELYRYLDLFPGLDEEKDEVERRIEKAAFAEAVMPPAQVRNAVFRTIAIEAEEQPATSWKDKNNVRFKNVDLPEGKIRVHIGWKILLIIFLSMIALSLLSAVVFSYMAAG